MIFAAILAGGTGSRMKLANMPKQFLDLGDKPVILHTIEKFLLVPEFDGVYVGVHPDWVDYTRELLEREGLDERVVVIAGGANRNGTIANILQTINEEYGADPENIIVTHDAVRPFVSLSIISENIKAAQEYGACDTVIPATDTIVNSVDANMITEIPDRSQLYQGQTPQSFKIGLLEDSFARLSDREKERIPDACKALVLAGYPVKLVDGAPENIKLTTVMDYRIAQALIDRLDESDAE
ncbi:MAG: 2-C-methyl-D-erythritol 4-phosphate cytidylyltransferase [Actinomycetaceae bacterium]|nr:2-C-methyl-D-erythritol 4-phosphate cytidylyltransferase [Actinomycetaceae bacterium]